MSTELVVLLVLAVAATALAALAFLMPLVEGRWRGVQGAGRPALDAGMATPVAPHTSPALANVAATAGVARGAYERVVRIVAFGFLFTTWIGVTLGGLWPSTIGAIQILVAAAGMFVVIVQDVLPAALLGRARYVLETVGALAFLTGLVALTGGPGSPFFFGYFLLIIAASLWADRGAPLILAVATGISYLIAIAVMPGATELQGPELTRIGFNILSLVLLSYLAWVVGREQRRSREAALRLSRFDPLTALYNRNYFFFMLEREVQRAARIKRRFCLLMIDVDDLKPVNDQYGHQYGDRLLRSVSDVIRSAIRASDLAAKYGGDEFVVILPETDPAGAYILAEKLRLGIVNIALRADTRIVRTSVSIGLATYPDDGITGDQLVMSADASMYRSKQLGKNRVTTAAAQSAEGGVLAGVASMAAPATPLDAAAGSGEANPQAGARMGTARGASLPPAGRGRGGADAERAPDDDWPQGRPTGREPTAMFQPRPVGPVRAVDVETWGPGEWERPPEGRGRA